MLSKLFSGLIPAVLVFSLLPGIVGCGNTYSSKSINAKINPSNWKLGSSTSLIKDLNPQVMKEVKESGIDFLEIGWKDLNLEGVSFADKMAYAKRVFNEASDRKSVV